MTLCAFPFKNLQFHGKNTCSWIAFIPPYCTMPTNTMDLEKKAHFDNVSYGRLILVFKCRLASRLSHPQQTVERDLAFIEELWPYTPTLNDADVLGELFDCRRLYRTSPKPTYYVIPVSRILGDAPILEAGRSLQQYPFVHRPIAAPPCTARIRAPYQTPGPTSTMVANCLW